MKLLIDAQLPRRLAHQCRAAGYDVLHTLDLPEGNRTSDRELIALADADGRVMVTKDADFVNAFVLTGTPKQLLLLSIGNITNDALAQLLLPQLAHLQALFAEHSFLELTRTTLIIHQ